ncbi:MAG: citrate synthase, partial [Clostridia bacterium]|nr:citrate synthase [Clostridia bacterium]
SFSSLEAKVLDMALVLHAEHGGGNNSTFTTHVVTSSGTDTYSSTAAALGSLKGPRHGGANIKVIQQMAEMKETVSDWTDEEEVAAYLGRLLNREAFDKAGLIYGLGHAIYTKSDPRARMLKEFVRRLSAEKGREDEFALYETVERIGPALVSGKRNTQKSICANVDFYSGFAYDMLGLPRELYTPIFAIARIAGWSAHRMEEIINRGKIIRPAYMNICPPRDYVPFDER